MPRALLCVVAIACAGCPHDVRVRYPSDADEPTGTVILAFSKPASDVIVAVNGHLVVDGEDTEKVVIEGIPTGTADLAIASGPGEKQMQVWVSEHNPITIPLGYPGSSTGDTIKGILSSLIGVLVYALVLR